MSSLRGLAILAVAALALLSLSSCASGAPRRIVVAVRELPLRLDPVRVSSPVEENACELLFDGLVNVAANDSGSATPVLGLAESIAQDQSDRSLYRITLRTTAWHDGRSLDSADVVASFAAYVDPANASARREYLQGFVSSVEPDGPLGVLVRFREPIAEFRAWYVLAFKIVPREYKGAPLPADRSGREGEAFSRSPVGTGPFRFASGGASEIVLDAYPAAFRAAPASPGIVLRRVPGSKERIQALLSGRVDLIADTGPLDRPLLERAGDVMVQSYMPQAFYSLAINLRRPELSSFDARASLVRAVNRSALVPGLTDRSSGVELCRGPFPDGLLTRVLPEYFRQGFPDRLPPSLGEAKGLAESSGLAAYSRSARGEGSETGLAIAYPQSWGEFGARLASGLVAQLGEARIAARPEALPDAKYAEVLRGGGFELALVYHEGFDNLYSGISSLYRSGSPWNETGVSDPLLDKLLASRDGAIEVTDWIRDTLAVHERVSALAPYVPLFSIEKDIFYRGVRGVLIASDNPFLTAERWSLGGGEARSE
jgi:peptide/nickel transport system substrate-binding protein